MGFLELAGIVLSLGVALPVCVGVIRKITGAMDVTETAMTKAGIVAAVGKTAIAEARASPRKAPAMEAATAVEPTAPMEAVKTPATVETTKATTTAECDGAFGTPARQTASAAPAVRLPASCRS